MSTVVVDNCIVGNEGRMSWVQQLRAIRDHDLEVKEAADELASLRREVAEFEKQKSNLCAEISKLQTSSDSHQLRTGDLELQVREAEEELQKLQKQKMNVVSEKSLQAVEQRIEMVLQKKDELELEWFEAQELLEGVVSNLNSLHQSEKELQARWQGRLGPLNERLGELQRSIVELKEQRVACLDGLETSLARTYEKLRARDDVSPAVFELEDQNCPRCGMAVDKQGYCSIRYDNRPGRCSSCGVILYWDNRE